MIVEVDGIVLNCTNYGESSKILNVITKEYGIIGIMAKGVRKLKSELRSVSDRLIYGTFNIYYKENKISTLISVDVINDLKKLKNDIINVSYGYYLCELTNQVMKQNNSNDIYHIFLSSLLKINDGFDAGVITNIVELKYLDYLGIMPVIDRCSICGNKTSIVTLSTTSGGYLCNKCITNTDLIVSSKSIKLVRLFYYVDISKIEKLEVDNKVKQEINTFLTDYYEKYTGLYLKSKDFLRNLVKLSN